VRLCVSLLVAAGCYSPNAATGVPCSSDGTCPGGQLCDTGQAPPVCVTSLGDAGAHDARHLDAPHDSPTTTPIAFVQLNQDKPTLAVTTLALPNTVASGDAIVVCFNYAVASGATLTSITDSLGNTYTTVVGPITAGGDIHYAAVALNVAAGADTITVTLDAPTGNGSDLFVLEYSGILGANAVDVTEQASGTGTAMSSTAGSTTNAHDLIIGYAEAPGATAGAGFTARKILAGNMVEDKVVFSTGSYDANAPTTSGNWEMIMVALKGH
jgi:hypothetical protein